MFEKYLSYGKVVRASFLLLFLISSLLCLFKPGSQSGLIAGLSLIAFIAFDVVCFLSKTKQINKEWIEKIDTLQKYSEELQKEQDRLDSEFRAVKDDLSVAKIGTVLGQMRK